MMRNVMMGWVLGVVVMVRMVAGEVGMSPELLVTCDGAVVETVEAWEGVRRPEIVSWLRQAMYGRAPGRPEGMRFVVREAGAVALDGRAIRSQVSIRFGDSDAGPSLELLVYRPREAEGAVPAFLGLNFWGNHAVHTDPGIFLSERWIDASRNPWIDLSGVKDGRATEACRGSNAGQWPVEEIVRRGYALVTAYRGDVHRDVKEAEPDGVHGLFPELAVGGDNFGVIGAWAWALSRALDYLEVDAAIDAKRVAVSGWSRLGKAAVWAGATDPRFAMVISIQSGAGGVKLFRRGVGEDIARLTTHFPYWYCRNFQLYVGRDRELPWDQHEMLALVAPRPVYVSSAQDDRLADPEGEFMGLKAVEPVYRLYGKGGVSADAWPGVREPVHGWLGYHMREGGHHVTAYDWEQYLAFADRHLKVRDAAR